jgi:hypothetical protein
MADLATGESIRLIEGNGSHPTEEALGIPAQSLSHPKVNEELGCSRLRECRPKSSRTESVGSSFS